MTSTLLHLGSQMWPSQHLTWHTSDTRGIWRCRRTWNKFVLITWQTMLTTGPCTGDRVSDEFKNVAGAVMRWRSSSIRGEKSHTVQCTSRSTSLSWFAWSSPICWRDHPTRLFLSVSFFFTAHPYCRSRLQLPCVRRRSLSSLTTLYYTRVYLLFILMF